MCMNVCMYICVIYLHREKANTKLKYNFTNVESVHAEQSYLLDN